MNNDLEQFSEERLKDMQRHVTAGMTLGHADALLIRQALDIALAAKQAKPIGKIHVKRESYADIDEFEVRIECLHPEADWENFKDGTLLYDTYPTHAKQTKQVHQFIMNTPDKDGFVEWADCNQEFFNSVPADQRRTLYTTPQPAHTEQDGCQWNPDEESVYFTGCGHEWQFTEGGIQENGITYCPYCSGKIAAPKPESE